MNKIEDLLRRALLAAKENDWVRCAQLVLCACKLLDDEAKEDIKMNKIENFLRRAILAAEEKDWVRCAQLTSDACRLIEEKAVQADAGWAREESEQE